MRSWPSIRSGSPAVPRKPSAGRAAEEPETARSAPEGPPLVRPAAASVRTGVACARATAGLRNAMSAARSAGLPTPPRPGTVGAPEPSPVPPPRHPRHRRCGPARPTLGKDVAAARRAHPRSTTPVRGPLHWLGRRTARLPGDDRLLLGDLGRLVRAPPARRRAAPGEGAAAVRRPGSGAGSGQPRRLDRLRRGRIGGRHESAGPARHVRHGLVGVPGFGLERPPRSCHAASLSGSGRRASGM